MFFPLETVEISECCVKREMCHVFSTNLRMLLRDAPPCPQAPGSILGQGTKNSREHPFTGKPSHSAAAALKILLSWRITPKKEKKFKTPPKAFASVACAKASGGDLPGGGCFPLPELAAKLGSGERALSAAWDGGGSGSRQEL